MVTFSIPDKHSFTEFKVEAGSVMFAGSRYLKIPQETARLIVSGFDRLGFSFLTGCAAGVDESFRSVLALDQFSESVIVACAFRRRMESLKGLFTLFVVPEGLAPRAALAKRTLWMVSRCSLLVLFPSEPFGKGSLLAFKSAIFQNKPVFVVSDVIPDSNDLYSVVSSNLFGVVKGYWCIPPVYRETKMCYEGA